MKSTLWNLAHRCLASGMLISGLIAPAAAQEDPAGVVRISTPRLPAVTQPAAPPALLPTQTPPALLTPPASAPAPVTQAVPSANAPTQAVQTSAVMSPAFQQAGAQNVPTRWISTPSYSGPPPTYSGMPTYNAPMMSAPMAAGRPAASPKIRRTSFSGVADGVSDGIDSFYEAVYGAPQRTQPPVRTVGFGHHHQPSEQYGAACGCQPSQSCQSCQPACVCGGGCPCGNCQGDCPSGNGRCRHGRGGCRHGHGHGNCDCQYCQGCPEHGWGSCDTCPNKYNTGCDMCNYFHCKFGFLCPSGNGGAGSPFFGHYARVYPQDVNYHDGRDSQLYAAPGYGAPMAVPLAPVVGHTYNYGWGIPSSRLTPISHLAR